MLPALILTKTAEKKSIVGTICGKKISRLCLIFRGELRIFLFRVSFGKEEEIVILFQSKFLLLLFIQLQLRERDVLLSSRSFLIRCRIMEEGEKTCLSSFDHLAAKGWNSTLARAGTSPILFLKVSSLVG